MIARSTEGWFEKAAERARSKDYAAASAVVESLRDLGQLSEGNVAEFARAGKFEETTVALAPLRACAICRSK